MNASTSGWSIRKYQPAPAQFPFVPYDVIATIVVVES